MNFKGIKRKVNQSASFFLYFWYMKYVIGILGLMYKLYVALVFTCGLILFYLPILICIKNPKWKRKAFNFFVLWSWFMRIFCLIHVVRKNYKTLPKTPMVIIANHASYLDIILFCSILPKHPFLFLGKSEILDYPLLKTFFKDLNIPVYRNNKLKSAKSFVEAKNRLAENWSLVIFPEGEIPDENTPQMVPFKEGAFKLAKAGKAAILPLTFQNNYKLFSDPNKPLGRAHPGISQVYFHPIITSDKVALKSIEELSDTCFKLIASKINA